MSPTRLIATGDRWRPTAAHLRAVAGGTVLAGVAVVLGRPDLLVLSTPLLVIALWSAAPGRVSSTLPTVRSWLDPDLVREGQNSRWTTQVEGATDVEHITMSLSQNPSVVVPAPVVGVGIADAGQPAEQVPVLELSTPLRPARWGTHLVGPATVSLTSRWASHQLVSAPQSRRTLTVLPQPAVFDGRAPLPHPGGLVGPDRGRRVSDGTEFFGIRSFAPGDRLRRVHWPVSLRTGALQVVTTNADQDSEVVLVVDAFSDLRLDCPATAGTSRSSRWRRIRSTRAPDDAASSLTVSVRAAGALAEHHLRRGDRVGVTVVGGARPLRVPPGVGGRHLLRVLQGLATVEPPSRVIASDVSQSLHGVRAGAVVVVVSPLLRPELVTLLLSSAGRGLTVLAVDTLPPDGVPPAQDVGMPTGAPDPWLPLAWRLRRLERAAALSQLLAAGVPVVPWRGPGSLDNVLRGLTARSGRARVVRR